MKKNVAGSVLRSVYHSMWDSHQSFLACRQVEGNTFLLVFLEQRGVLSDLQHLSLGAEGTSGWRWSRAVEEIYGWKDGI